MYAQNAITFKARWEEEFLKVPCLCILFVHTIVNDVHVKWMQYTKFDMLYAQQQPRFYEKNRSGAHKSVVFFVATKHKELIMHLICDIKNLYIYTIHPHPRAHSPTSTHPSATFVLKCASSCALAQC